MLKCLSFRTHNEGRVFGPLFRRASARTSPVNQLKIYGAQCAEIRFKRVSKLLFENSTVRERCSVVLPTKGGATFYWSKPLELTKCNGTQKANTRSDGLSKCQIQNCSVRWRCSLVLLIKGHAMCELFKLPLSGTFQLGTKKLSLCLNSRFFGR